MHNIMKIYVRAETYVNFPFKLKINRLYNVHHLLCESKFVLNYVVGLNIFYLYTLYIE